MKAGLLLFADFDAGLFGPADLACPLAGTPLLVRTLRRAAAIDGVERRVLLVRPQHAAQAAELLALSATAAAFELLAEDSGRRPKRALIRAARRWNATSWRGAPLGATWFDEYCEPLEAARVMDRYELDALLALDARMPLLAPEIARAQLDHARGTPEAAFVCTQAPPGLAGIVLRKEALRDLLTLEMPVGLLLSYRPEMPRSDPIARAECVRLAASITHTAARFTADTRRSRALLETALAALGEHCSAAELCTWVAEQARTQLSALPEEIEIELTTDDPLPETTLRPRGARVAQREVRDFDAVSRVVAELAADEDARIILGGCGDPLRHPQFAEILRRVRSTTDCALGVVTPLVELPESALQELFEQRVDVLEVQLDADTPETYQRVHGSDQFARVLANLERLHATRVERRSPLPLVLPSLTRCGATIAEMDAFYDRWVQRCGGAVLRGYRTFGGALPGDVLLPLTPPARRACARLNRRMTLLAGGAIARCDEDVHGAEPLGDWRTQSLAGAWNGPPLVALRRAHESGDLQKHPACAACGEWYRA